jgi:uracil-DNA glycosylase
MTRQVRPVPGAEDVVITAKSCPDWPALAAAARACVACPELAATRQHVVVGDVPAGAAVRQQGGSGAGSGLARLVLVGEAPGKAEDEQGRPFVGKAGQLLDELLAGAGLDRNQLAVINVLRCRPPANRTPRPDEAARCRAWLDRSLELIDPELIVALGSTAAAAFLGRGVKLGASRGRTHQVGDRQLLVTYHPSAAIRFGPNGLPRAALAEDLALAAALLGS